MCCISEAPAGIKGDAGRSSTECRAHLKGALPRSSSQPAESHDYLCSTAMRLPRAVTLGCQATSIDSDVQSLVSSSTGSSFTESAAFHQKAVSTASPPAALQQLPPAGFWTASGPASPSPRVTTSQPQKSQRAVQKVDQDSWSRALYGLLAMFLPVESTVRGQAQWLRLSRSQADLNGLHGTPLRRGITLDEVARHRSPADAWTVLRGKVYNMTAYLRFHPGGRAMIMQAAGIDGTALFNKYHAWVKADALLEKCCVGWLAMPHS